MPAPPRLCWRSSVACLPAQRVRRPQLFSSSPDVRASAIPRPRPRTGCEALRGPACLCSLSAPCSSHPAGAHRHRRAAGTWSQQLASPPNRVRGRSGKAAQCHPRPSLIIPPARAPVYTRRCMATRTPSLRTGHRFVPLLSFPARSANSARRIVPHQHRPPPYNRPDSRRIPGNHAASFLRALRRLSIEIVLLHVGQCQSSTGRAPSSRCTEWNRARS